jgi:hypothetical protein
MTSFFKNDVTEREEWAIIFKPSYLLTRLSKQIEMKGFTPKNAACVNDGRSGMIKFGFFGVGHFALGFGMNL